MGGGFTCLCPDKNPYRHDGRADKDSYRHDRRADSHCPDWAELFLSGYTDHFVGLRYSTTKPVK